MRIKEKVLLKLIREEINSLYSDEGEEDSVFQERELTHEIRKTLNELSFYIEKASDSVEYPTDMDTIEVTTSQLKKWKDVLVKFLMAIGG